MPTNTRAHEAVKSGDVLSLEEYKAKQFLEDGKYHISMGDLDMAVESLKKSLNQRENPEALTYLAWVLSLKNETDAAIAFCKQAVILDPESGTALNDLGQYYIQKEDFNEAIVWLEKAKGAKYQDSPHFPYINLGRIYSDLGDFDSALREFKLALELSPGHKEIQKVLKELEEIQNNA